MLDLVIVATENVSISRMERLYALLSQCIYRHREDDDKTELVKVNSLSCTPFCHVLLYICMCVLCICVCVMCMYVCTVNTTLTWQYTLQLSCLFHRAFISVWKTFIRVAKPLLCVAKTLPVSAGKGLKTMGPPTQASQTS